MWPGKAVSRLLGGIDFGEAPDNGAAPGKSIGELVLKRGVLQSPAK
ncbi:MAG: hypothetical protein ABI813_04445 [Bacteroidota bacterium]